MGGTVGAGEWNFSGDLGWVTIKANKISWMSFVLQAVCFGVCFLCGRARWERRKGVSRPLSPVVAVIAVYRYFFMTRANPGSAFTIDCASQQ